MTTERRHFSRGSVAGTALIYDGSVQPTDMLNVSLGGIRVLGKSTFSDQGPFWVEFTFKKDNRLLFGKRAMAKLQYSKFDKGKRRFVMGFEFLNLTEFQRHIISSVLDNASF